MNTRLLSDEEMDNLIERYEREMLNKHLNVEEVIVLDKYGNKILDVTGTKNEVQLLPYESKIKNASIL